MTREPLTHRYGHETETEAAASMAGIAVKLREQVLNLLREHPEGLTDDEGAELLGWSDRLKWGRRRHELHLDGLVEKTDQHRLTSSRRRAIVWRAVA